MQRLTTRPQRRRRILFWELAAWALFIAAVTGIILVLCAAAWVVAP